MARTGNTTQINVTVPKILDKRLRELAQEQGRSFSNLIAWLLTQAIKKEG